MELFDRISRSLTGLTHRNDSNDYEDEEQDNRYISDGLRLQVLEKYDYRCAKCGSTTNLELDHKIPISRGGATSLRNLQVLCRRCNRRKGHR